MAKKLVKKQSGGPAMMWMESSSSRSEDKPSRKEVRKEKVEKVKAKVKEVASNIKQKLTNKKTSTPSFFKKGGITKMKKK